MAAEIYQKEPANTAYAFALHTKGDTRGALAIMNVLAPEKLREPSIAAYQGIFLANAGDQARAAEFLALSTSAELLPEENAPHLLLTTPSSASAECGAPPAWRAERRRWKQVP